MDLQNAFNNGFEMLKLYVDAQLSELGEKLQPLAPDDVAQQVAKALAIVAGPPIHREAQKPPPPQMPLPPAPAPSIVNVAIPPPRRTQKEIKMRRDENNNLIADVIEHDLD